MTVSNGPAVLVLRRIVDCHSAQRAEARRIPEEVTIFENALISILAYRFGVYELRLFERKAAPLVAFLGDYRIFLDNRIFWGFASLNIRGNAFQSYPFPAIRNLKRHLVRYAFIAQHTPLGVHALLIGGAIGSGRRITKRPGK